MPEDTPNPLIPWLDLLEAYKPLLEFANGIRNQLLADGWNPANAETVAIEALINTIRSVRK